MSATLKTVTGIWLHERYREAGTPLAVVAKPNPKAEKPVEVDPGAAALLVRQGKATHVSVVTDGESSGGGRKRG